MTPSVFYKKRFVTDLLQSVFYKILRGIRIDYWL